MGQPSVGTGDLIFQPPLGAIDAAAGIVSTPIRVGRLQDITLDYSVAVDEQYGEKGFAAEVAFGKRKLGGKAKFGMISGRLLAMCFDGSVLTSGSSNLEVVESGTVSAGAVTVSGSANYIANLGVYDSSGNELKQVASAPAGLQYSVSAGVYTFNVSQNAQIYTFRYTKSQSSGNKMQIVNPTMGIPIKFGLKLYNYYAANASKNLAFEFGAVAVPKLSFPFKNSDFVMPDMDFTVLDDGTGNVGTSYIDVL